MNIRTHHLVVSVLVWAMCVGSMAYLLSGSPAAHATCASGSSVNITAPISTSGGTNNPLSGIVTLKAQEIPTGASGISFTLMIPNQQPIGNAMQMSNGWELSWDTRNVPNGSYAMLATAHYGTLASYDCASATIPFTVNNLATTTPSLQATITPNTWQGPVGSSAVFNVTARYTDQYGRQSNVAPSNVNWHSPIGLVSPNGGVSTVFTAGPTLTTGPLIADVMYGSFAYPATAQIKIIAPSTTTSPSPTPLLLPSPLPGTITTTASPTPVPVSTEDAARLSTMPTVFRPASPTNSDPVVSIPTLSCLEKAIGKVRFAEISNGSQPTASERALAAACFTGSNPIPAVLAPVPPLKMTELATTTDLITMGTIRPHTTTSKDGKTVSSLLLSGTGVPNSDIFIYVFSDPLVLHATTDSHGIWSYVLDTPLKAGKHEVYAVAQKDSATFVRTSAVPITVAAAAPGGSAGGLVIESKYSRAQIGFAAAAFALLVGAIFIVIFLLRRKRHVVAPAVVAPASPAMIMPTQPAGSIVAPPQATPSPETAPAPPVSLPSTPQPTPLTPSNETPPSVPGT